jgi:hypothetical protein
MRRVLIPCLLAVAVLAAGGCGGGDDDGSGDDTTAGAPTGGDLYTQTTHKGTLSPVAGKDDVFQLTFAEPSPDVTVFTDRPVRSASTEALADFVGQWDQRGFGQDPPNAALVLDQEPDDADTAVFTLADPTYDQASGAVTYTATHVNGGSSSLPSDEDIDPPPSFGDAHLFIDPSGAGDQHAMALDVNGASGGNHTQITFDSPWTIFIGPGEQGTSWIVGPNPGGGFAEPSTVNLTSSGGAQFELEGGTGAITGTATIPKGATVGLQVDDNPEQTIKNGKFSLSP